MKSHLFALAFIAIVCRPLPSATAQELVGYGEASAVYQVHHGLRVTDLPPGAKKARVWFWFPDDDDYQKVRTFSIKAAGDYRLTRDAVHGHRYLYCEVANPEKEILLTTDFVIQRRSASYALDPAKAGPITESQRRLLAEYLRKDDAGKEANEEIAELARRICGKETSVVRQADLLAGWVVANSDHYSIPGAPKSSGIGSAFYCFKHKGGGCTDQHALFIALARERGIPCRLHFGSILRPKNEGKDHNPGYRCWVQYFVPEYGWVSTDLSEADITGKKDFTTLDERHVRFAEGRSLQLTPAQEGPPVNLFVGAYVEVDGRPHATFERVVRFKQMR